MAIVTTVCIKNNESLLMIQEAKPKAYGLWNFPSGHLELNEDIFKGALREAKEETGYNIELTSLLSIQNNIRNEKPILRIVFNAKIVSGDINFDDNEILQVKWISINELEKMDANSLRSYESFQDILKDIKNDINYPLEIVKNIIYSS